MRRRTPALHRRTARDSQGIGRCLCRCGHSDGFPSILQTPPRAGSDEHSPKTRDPQREGAGRGNAGNLHECRLWDHQRTLHHEGERDGSRGGQPERYLGPLDSATLKLHDPVSAGTAIRTDKPREGPPNFGGSVLRHGGRYLLYFRWHDGEWGQGRRTMAGTTSKDFITWKKPALMTYGDSNWVSRTNFPLTGILPTRSGSRCSSRETPCRPPPSAAAGPSRSPGRRVAPAAAADTAGASCAPDAE